MKNARLVTPDDLECISEFATSVIVTGTVMSVINIMDIV